MIVAANHVADLHVHVVHDDAKIVGGRAIGTRDDEIIEFAV